MAYLQKCYVSFFEFQNVFKYTQKCHNEVYFKYAFRDLIIFRKEITVFFKKASILRTLVSNKALKFRNASLDSILLQVDG